jgi:hypothetical protein
MSTVDLPNAFVASYSKFEKYPLRLVLRDTYGLSRLRLVRKRFEERAPYLFVADSKTHVAVKDVQTDGSVEKRNLYSDLEIQDWLGVTSPASAAEGLVATKEDPRCRFV